MSIINIAAYKFLALDHLAQLREELYRQCDRFSLKGTILLGAEGININLSGARENMTDFEYYLRQDKRFADLYIQRSSADHMTFKRLKVKIKKEIITMNQPHLSPTKKRAPSLAPQKLKQWLDEERDMVLLDTRNHFEINYGTFNDALNLRLHHFGEFPEAIKSLPQTKPIVMFCTGGIRCEKAALVMLQQGFSEVYQLQGGILNYFATVGDAHYQGKCFVFDEREAILPQAMLELD